MMNSLEVRVPFLDPPLLHTSPGSAPGSSSKMEREIILEEGALSGILPAETLNRRKMGFGVPIRRLDR